MNKLVNAMKEVNNYKLTENGGLAYKSTMSGLMDLFALGGAYRTRSDADCITLFKAAFAEDETLALKCLFYLRDVRGGQGERRFFRTVTRWLANNETEAMRRNLALVPEYGRWDDLYVFVDTPLEADAFQIMYHQLALDVSCKTPSLLAKWLKSENTSSPASRALGEKTRVAFKMTAREYRKTLSTLRARIRIVERLMSENRWDEIEFDKLPSKAGFIYRNAFARHDLVREKYEKFAKDTTTKVNAKTLNPCDVVHQALKVYNRGRGWTNGLCRVSLEDTERLMVNKYWDNLEDYFHNAVFNGVAVVDTSGSMTGWDRDAIAPIDVAVALGMYCAEKCSPKSPWYGNYITFSANARLVPVVGADFVDKVGRIMDANLCQNTNIESVFNLILNLAIKNHVPQKDMPENIVIISDMEFDAARGYRSGSIETVMEKCMRKYTKAGYRLPKLVFWNVEARNDTIPMRDEGYISFVSGYSPVLFEQIMSGKSGIDLILDKLNSERYAAVK